MSEDPIAGFPEMWKPVYEKYKLFFDPMPKLQGIVNEMVNRPLKGDLAQTIGRLVLAGANTYGALLTLVLNGYGPDAMKLARSIYETELNIIRLKLHPAELADFMGYNAIQQKHLYDVLDDEQKKQVSKEQYDKMMAEYNRVLPQFATSRDKTRPRNEWCRVSLYERAKEVEEYWRQQAQLHGQTIKDLSLYQTFYRTASSLHHGDIGGLIAQTDSELKVELAPSWSWLEDALTAGMGSLIRCLNEFDEIVGLGFKDRLQSGPNEDYVKAVKNLLGIGSQPAQ